MPRRWTATPLPTGFLYEPATAPLAALSQRIVRQLEAAGPSDAALVLVDDLTTVCSLAPLQEVLAFVWGLHALAKERGLGVPAALLRSLIWQGLCSCPPPPPFPACFPPFPPSPGGIRFNIFRLDTSHKSPDAHRKAVINRAGQDLWIKCPFHGGGGAGLAQSIYATPPPPPPEGCIRREGGRSRGGRSSG